MGTLATSHYSLREEIASSLIHGIGIVLSIVGLAVLVGFAALYGDARHVASVAVFGATLILLYTASTLYHGVPNAGAKPTLRALTYARASRPTVLEAITVDVDPEDTARLQADWERMEIPVTLKVLASPYREVTRPVIEYVRALRRDRPADLVTVFIPEYVVGHWWEQLLHNQSALRLKSRLLFTPGVMVTSVPWQLQSSDRVIDRDA